MSFFILPNILSTIEFYGVYTALNKTLILSIAKLSTVYLFKPPLQLSIIIKYYY